MDLDKRSDEWKQVGRKGLEEFVGEVVSEEVVEEKGVESDEYYAVQWSRSDALTLKELLYTKYRHFIGLSHMTLESVEEDIDDKTIFHWEETAWHESLSGKFLRITVKEGEYGYSASDVEEFRKPKRLRS